MSILNASRATRRRLAGPLAACLLLTLALLAFSPPASAAGVDHDEKGITWGRAGDADKDFPVIQNAGITWVRSSIWSDRDTRGSNSLRGMRAIVDKGAARHIEFLLNPVARDLGNAAHRAAYKQWLTLMVHTFKDRVHVWEIGNEPNLKQFWNISGQPGDASWNDAVHRYVQLLADAHQAIKAADPTATVVSAGLSQYRANEYLDRMIAEHADRYVDAVGLHPYGSDPADTVRRVNEFRRHMARSPAMAHKPLWLTEFGWQSSFRNYFPFVASEQIKARYLTETMGKLRAAGVHTPVFWYNFSEANITTRPGSARLNGFGLVRQPSQDGPLVLLSAYEAMRRIPSGRSSHPRTTSTTQPTVTTKPTATTLAPGSSQPTATTQLAPATTVAGGGVVASETTTTTTRGNDLPFTGSGVIRLLLPAVGLLALGAVTVAAARRRGRHSRKAA